MIRYDSPNHVFCHKLIKTQALGGFNMMLNQVPNLNHHPVNPNDQRFGFLPFLGGLTVGALAGGFGGGRPCCGPPPPQFMPMPPQFIPVPIQTLPAQLPPQQFVPMQPFQNVQGPILESNKFYIR